VESGGETVGVQAVIYRALFASWLEPRDASLAFALCFTGFWLLVLWALYKRNIIVRV
jgi:predicted acyltransferase